MSSSYDYAVDQQHTPTPRRVMVTGAAGRIGRYFARHAPEHYTLSLMDRPDAENLEAPDDHRDRCQTVRADLADLEALKQHFANHDVLVHLAADPRPHATWDSIHDNNLTGTYHAFVAAQAAGVKRVVFASSIHAVSGYPPDRQVHPDDPVNPGDLYGVSKAFGEAMGRFMSQQQGLSVICIRIGAFQPVENAKKRWALKLANTFVSRRDLHQLICRSIDAGDGLRFAIFHGLSNNRFNRLDITSAREMLGYAPQDDFTEHNRALQDLQLNDEVTPHDERHGQASGLREQL